MADQVSPSLLPCTLIVPAMVASNGKSICARIVAYSSTS
jgi:hypothetical protein